MTTLNQAREQAGLPAIHPTPRWRRLLARALHALAAELEPSPKTIITPAPTAAEVERMRAMFAQPHGRNRRGTVARY